MNQTVSYKIILSSYPQTLVWWLQIIVNKRFQKPNFGICITAMKPSCEYSTTFFLRSFVQLWTPSSGLDQLIKPNLCEHALKDKHYNLHRNGYNLFIIYFTIIINVPRNSASASRSKTFCIRNLISNWNMFIICVTFCCTDETLAIPPFLRLYRLYTWSAVKSFKLQ